MSLVFPSMGMQILSALIYFLGELLGHILRTSADIFLGLSILAHCLSRRVLEVRRWSSLKEMSWARLSILLVFVDSWMFLFVSKSRVLQAHPSSFSPLNPGGILIFGVGLETIENACKAGIFICVVFYATSKLLIYCFLGKRNDTL